MKGTPEQLSALDAARRAQRAYEREKPEWWRWVTGGQPTLTVAEYEALPTTRKRSRSRGELARP